MNALQVFNYEATQIRVLQIEGEPWWVAKDVCSVLEVDQTQTRRLDDDEKGLRSIQTPGGAQEMLVVNEPGLYSLILGSRKPEAKAFKRWITHEVIPQIRKTGSYATPQTQSELILMIAQRNVEQEKQLAQLSGTVDAIKETIVYQPDNWREDINRMLNKVANALGPAQYRDARTNSYKVLEARARVDLERRLKNHRDRLRNQGASATAVSKACKLDVIEENHALREIYTQVVREQIIKYCA